MPSNSDLASGRPLLAKDFTASHPSFSSETKRGRTRVRTLRSVLGSADNIFDDNPRPDKTSSPAKSRSRSVFGISPNGLAFPSTVLRSFFLHRFHKKSRPDNSDRYR